MLDQVLSSHAEENELSPAAAQELTLTLFQLYETLCKVLFLS